MNKLLQSSADPTKLSLTIKGLLLGLVPLAMVLLHPVDPDLFQTSLVNAIETLATVLSAIITLYGAVRKVVNAYKK